MKKRNKTFSVFSLVASCFIYGFFPILVRAIGFKIPIFYQNWTRTFLEFIILTILVAVYKKWIKINPKDYSWLITRCVGGLIGFLGAYYSFIYLPIGTAYFIFYAGSLAGGFFLGKIMFGEKITKLKWISLTVGLIGLFFVYSFSFATGQLVGALMAIASGFGTAIWNVSSKKISGRYSALQLSFIDTGIYGIIVFAISLFLKESWPAPAFNTPWIANLLFAFVFITTGQLMIIGFKNIEGQLGSLIMMLEVVFGIFFGFLFFGETVSLRTMFGGVLILTALAISQSKIKNKLLS